MTTPPGAAFGTQQGAHTGSGPRRHSTHSFTVAVGPTGDMRNIGAFVTDEEVVTKDEAKEAFASVQESFASVGEEQGKLKEGLHGLASKVDEVQSKAAEDLTALAHAVDETFSQAGSVASDLSA